MRRKDKREKPTSAKREKDAPQGGLDDELDRLLAEASAAKRANRELVGKKASGSGRQERSAAPTPRPDAAVPGKGDDQQRRKDSPFPRVLLGRNATIDGPKSLTVNFNGVKGTFPPVVAREVEARPVPEWIATDAPVFYQGARWYVSGTTFTGQYTCIRELRAHPSMNPKQVSQWVPTGCLKQAPPSRVDKPPTVAARQQKARASAGQRDIGDEVAKLLAGCKGYEDMCACASKVLGEPQPALIAKYQHLDAGRRRMTLGNRMRAALRKGAS